MKRFKFYDRPDVITPEIQARIDHLKTPEGQAEFEEATKGSNVIAEELRAARTRTGDDYKILNKPMDF